MKKYEIVEAHSGTDKNEIEKAKRIFRKKFGNTYYGNPDVKIIMKFTDINYNICVEFFEKDGEMINPICYKKKLN